MIQAGCRAATWKEDFDEYYWKAAGSLLAEGACVMNTTDQSQQSTITDLAPELGNTKVWCTFKNQQIRHIDSKKQTLSLDVELTMRWWDNRIKSNRIFD